MRLWVFHLLTNRSACDGGGRSRTADDRNILRSRESSREVRRSLRRSVDETPVRLAWWGMRRWVACAGQSTVVGGGYEMDLSQEVCRARGEALKGWIGDVGECRWNLGLSVLWYVRGMFLRSRSETWARCGRAFPVPTVSSLAGGGATLFCRPASRLKDPRRRCRISLSGGSLTPRSWSWQKHPRKKSRS